MAKGNGTATKEKKEVDVDWRKLPRVPPETKKTEILSVKISERQMERAKDAAAEQEVTLAEFVRQALTTVIDEKEKDK